MEQFFIFSCLINFLLWHVQADSFSSTLGHIKPQVPESVQEKAVQDLIKRVLPNDASRFERIFVIESMKTEDGKDVFELKKLGRSKVQITASSGVAAAAAFNYYLKFYLHSQISWETSQLNFPVNWPDIEHLRIVMNDRFRYYQNVCTASYSFVWWDWKQWEKHIDWIVLNSFNLVLAFNGQEAIWQRVYEQFHLTQSEIDEHFSGPAFMSWMRLGNMRGFGGPLSKAWHQRSLFLQKNILARLRSFGVTTVLPAFNGNLPRGFKRLYPNAKMTEIGPWNDFENPFCCPYFLDPTEELFNQIGKAFLKEQIAEFATDHVYSSDSFNENLPSSGNLTYLSNVGKSIYKSMTDVDSKSIWLLQGWLFHHDGAFWDREKAKAYVTSIPLGKMIILDLQSEQWPQYDRLEQYFGQPYIWCMLNNFGGTLGMFGSSSIINERVFKARNATNSTMIGTGLTPEGINQNYAIYDLMIESAWRKTPYNLTQWVDSYASRRYGMKDWQVTQAWIILQKTVYDYSGLENMRGKYTINRSPSLKISTSFWYSTSDLEEAWRLLLKNSDKLKVSSGYLHDVVDVTRQVLQVKGDLIYKEMIKAFNQKNLEDFNKNAVRFLDIFPDLDSILGTNEAFLLGKWLAAAKAAANNSNEERLFEYNARNQITLWGPRGEIMDYANKQWAGVVSHFFYPRWKMFIGHMNESLTTGQAFNQSFVKNKIFDEVEKPFTLDTTVFPDKGLGDTVRIAKAIYDKWSSKPIIQQQKVTKNKLTYYITAD